MRNFLWGGLLTLTLLSTSLTLPQFVLAEAPSVDELEEVASLAKRFGERENLFDVPSEIKPLITASSAKFGVPEAILAGLIKKESEFRNIWGMDGSGRGVAQIDSYWHPEVSNNEAFDPLYALSWASKYLKGLYEEYGNWYNALRAYNGGPNYASWYAGYGGMSIAYITTLYANTIYEFAGEYAVKENVEAVPTIAEKEEIKSTSAELIKKPIEEKPADKAQKAIEEAKDKPCNEASCVLPTDFKDVNLAQAQTEVEPKL